jgi:hypothetical protein
MKKYAKFIDKDTIEFPPQNTRTIINYNLDEKQLIKDGYLPFLEVKQPKGKVKFEYKIINNKIIKVWVS